MSFTLGRASLPSDPSRASWSGDQLTISGWINPTTANDTNHAYALRQQLLGLMNNPDEQVFPCTFSVDPNWDGYYYVNSVSVNGEPGLMEIQGRMQYSVTLTKIPGYGKPLVEVLVGSVVRTNTFGIATPVGIIAAIPSVAGTAEDYDFSAFSPSTTATQTADDGGFVLPYTSAAPLSTGVGSYFITPATYYKASCKVEVKYGSTYYPVVGNQIPSATAGNWRLSNGLVRVSPTNTANMLVEVWTGAAWESAEFAVTSGAGTTTRNMTGDAGGYFTPTILRNTPDLVSLRIRNAFITYSLAIARGGRLITLSWTLGSGTLDMGMTPVPTAASTAMTGGLYRTANDANGNRFVICSQGAFTSDLGKGWVYLTAAAASGAFGFGLELNGTGSVAPNGNTSMRDQFFAMSTPRISVVSR